MHDIENKDDLGEPIETLERNRDTGFRETTTTWKYYFDERTGKVTEVTIESNEMTFDKREERNYHGKEMGRKELEPNEIPYKVRIKIEERLKQIQNG
jgi:hypothetical protein